MYTSSAIRYFLYVRKSSESEDRQVQSIEDQKAVLLRFAKALNLTIVGIFEEAHSAKIPNTRAVYDDMMKRTEKGEANGILCWQINRLFRNTVEYGTTAWLLQTGVIQSIRTPDREYLPTDNVLILASEAGVATQYSIDLSKNVKRGLDEKAERGLWPLGAKPGYSSEPIIIGDKILHQIAKDPERFYQLRKAWDMILTRSYTVPKVVGHLDQAGFRLAATRKQPSRPISRTTLYRIFHDPFYYGAFRYNGAVRQGSHPPMVTKTEFDRVQGILKNSDAKPQKHEFAYSGLIRCAVCGCLVTPERKTKRFKTTGRSREYVYYHCSGYRGCPKDSLSEERIYDRIAQLLATMRLDPPFKEWAEPILCRYYGTQVEPLDQSDATLRRKHSAAKDRIDRLFELREAGEITASEFAERKAAYQNEANRLDEEITEGMSRIRDNAQAIHKAVAYLVDAPGQFEAADVSGKREIAAMLARSYILTNDKRLVIVPDPLLERLATFEPPKDADDQVGNGTPRRENPTIPQKKARAKYPTFEPRKRAKYMVRDRELALTNPVQRAWQNHLRNLIAGEKVSFGEATN